MSPSPLAFVVGVDALDRARGALAFARFIHGRGGTRVTPVHVVELAPEVFPEWVTSATRVWSAEVARATLAELAPDLPALDLVEAMPPEEALGQAAQRLEVDAIILGRRARSDELALFRLGGVARRMLRELRRPVLIVPPEFQAPEDGSQPIVLASDLSAADIDAARLAGRLARSLDAPLEVVHVAEPLPPLPPDIDFEARSKMLARSREERKNALETWCMEAQISQARRHIMVGEVLSGLRRAIDDLRPLAVVCGSRRLGEVRRIFATSVGSSLAAVSPVPVMVVPAG